ncbi:MAG: metal ABC transporter substrate-binding protein [Lachnospiraceae bacterium]|nr:metal ABC transporter substrate-binding protein [Lachnospiraceae bacterium]
MKYIKKIFSILLLAMLLFSVTACSNKEKKQEEEKLSIVTTLFPNYDFAKQIAGDKAEVTLLLDPGVEAHDYDPTPADIISINKSDLFIYTGDFMEVWASQIIDSLDNKNLQIVDASKGIELISTEDEEHETSDESKEHSHEYDPHIWTSPKNAITMVNTILEAIVLADPDNEDYYRKNAASYVTQIQEIDNEIRAVVNDAKQDTIYFGGRFAMIYFVREYGLGYMSAFDSCSSETEPSAKLVTKMVDAMKKNGASVVFYEELTDHKSAQAIADEIGGTTLLLHSCHNVSAEDFKNGATYVSLMKQNIENLKTGLGEN